MRLSATLSTLLHRRLAALKRGAITVRAAAAAGRLRLRLAAVNAAGEPETMIRLCKPGSGRLEMEVDHHWLRSRSGFSTLWRRLGTLVRVVGDRRLGPGSWQADLGDFVQSEGAVIGFSSRHAESLLVPDRGFTTTGGYARIRRLAASAPPFEARQPLVVWRGSPSGHGLTALPEPEPLDSHDPRLRQRVRLCLLAREARAAGLAGLDIRFARSRSLGGSLSARYAAVGILADPLPPASWLGLQYAIDIDGYGNAYSNLFTRLLFGCCVIKIGSPQGFRQWYYDRLVPWRHYLPVRADLTDFLEVLAWARDNPSTCRSIAAAGQALAMSMTLAEEHRRAVERLAAA